MPIAACAPQQSMLLVSAEQASSVQLQMQGQLTGPEVTWLTKEVSLQPATEQMALMSGCSGSMWMPGTTK